MFDSIELYDSFFDKNKGRFSNADAKAIVLAVGDELNTANESNLLNNIVIISGAMKESKITFKTLKTSSDKKANQKIKMKAEEAYVWLCLIKDYVEKPDLVDVFCEEFINYTSGGNKINVNDCIRCLVAIDNALSEKQEQENKNKTNFEETGENEMAGKVVKEKKEKGGAKKVSTDTVIKANTEMKVSVENLNNDDVSKEVNISANEGEVDVNQEPKQAEEIVEELVAEEKLEEKSEKEVDGYFEDVDEVIEIVKEFEKIIEAESVLEALKAALGEDEKVVDEPKIVDDQIELVEEEKLEEKSEEISLEDILKLKEEAQNEKAEAEKLLEKAKNKWEEANKEANKILEKAKTDAETLRNEAIELNNEAKIQKEKAETEKEAELAKYNADLKAKLANHDTELEALKTSQKEKLAEEYKLYKKDKENMLIALKGDIARAVKNQRLIVSAEQIEVKEQIDQTRKTVESLKPQLMNIQNEFDEVAKEAESTKASLDDLVNEIANRVAVAKMDLDKKLAEVNEKVEEIKKGVVNTITDVTRNLNDTSSNVEYRAKETAFNKMMRIYSQLASTMDAYEYYDKNDTVDKEDLLSRLSIVKDVIEENVMSYEFEAIESQRGDKVDLEIHDIRGNREDFKKGPCVVARSIKKGFKWANGNVQIKEEVEIMLKEKYELELNPVQASEDETNGDN